MRQNRKKMKVTKIYICLFILQTVIFSFYSCSKEIEPNQKPNLNINYTIEGLKVILTGSAIDSDGKIFEVKIDWGDSKVDKILSGDFTDLENNHIYSEPAAYNITVTASDNTGNTTSQSLPVLVDFKEVDIGNIKETMFKISDNEYLILTMNLHTYQESQQNEKFYMLTEVIGKMDIDFIAFQECAQHKSSAVTEGIIHEDNMALIVVKILKEKFDIDYNFEWHWAHFGWDVWEEGVSVLSKHDLIDSENRYISSNTSTSSISSRKAIFGSYQIPEGIFNFFSTHTHWRLSETDEEQNNQINNIQLMVDEKELLNPVLATFVCGDFNVNPTSDYPWSEGYHTMINNDEYIDTFLDIYPDANNNPAQSIYYTVGGTYPGRIDYIFMKSNNHFIIVDSQIIFTNDVVGKISDHNGVLTKISYIE